MASVTSSPADSALSPPIFLYDPEMNSRIQASIWSSYGLEYSERAVLTAVLQHMPTPAPTADFSLPITDRILALPLPLLKLLARLFTTALLDARSWGGTKPKSGGTQSRTTTNISTAETGTVDGDNSVADNPLSKYSPLFAALGLSALPDTVPSDENYNDGRDTPAPTSHSRHRSAREKDLCFKRHRYRCPITFRKESLTHAHLIPHSITSMSSSAAAPFWMLLSICLGPTIRDRVFATVGGALSFSTTNSIALDSSLHQYFDKGLFHLVPIDANQDPAQTATCDVRLQWRGSDAELRGLMTPLPQNLEDQVTISTTNQRMSYNVPADAPYRQVVHGDHFRLWTSKPNTAPLPHPLLLQVHALLWSMIAAAGMAQPEKGRAKRQYREAALDSDYDSDDGAAGARKVQRRAKKKNGSGGGEGPLPEPGDNTTIVQGAAGASLASDVDAQQRMKPLLITAIDGFPASLPASSASSSTTSLGASDITSDYKKTPPARTVKQLPKMPLNKLHLEWINFQLKMHAASGLEGSGIIGRARQSRWYESDSEEDYTEDSGSEWSRSEGGEAEEWPCRFEV